MQRRNSKKGDERGGDSPDFNRNTYDDLTISKTDLSHTDTSYRENVLGDLTKRGQNRTFADSVINHQINNPYTSSSNNNTHRNNYSSNQESQRNSGKR